VITPDLTENGKGSLSKNGVTYVLKGLDTAAQGGWCTLQQGGSFTNSTIYSAQRFAGLKITFTRLSDYGSLLYKGSRYAITSPNNAAYQVNSDVYLPLLDSSSNSAPFNYLSVYAAVGRFRIESLTLYTTTAAQPAEEGTKYVDFYGINDTHGAAEYKVEPAASTYQIGITRLSDYYQKQAKANPDGSVILSSGDMWQGSADSNLTKGAVMVNWMNLVGFEAMAVGNHEFDWGVNQIAENSHLANFPFLGINIEDANQTRPSWAVPSKTIYRQGVKIGIVGAIGNVESSIATSSLGGYSFVNDYASMVSTEAARLRNEGCRAVVVIVHNGSFDTTNCQNVDAVFEGHSHQSYFETDSYGIPHVQCYANGSMVQHLQFALSGSGFTFVSQDSLGTNNMSELSEEPMTLALYSYYLAQTTVIKNEVVGHTDNGYDKSAIGAIGAKALLSYMKEAFPSYNIVASLLNTGGVRQTIPAGDITFGEIYATFPFDNENHLCSTTGNMLKSMMNSGFYCQSDIDPSYLNPSTIYYFTTLSYTSEGFYSSSLTIVQRDTYFLRNIVGDYFRNGGI
jgi:5''-nucleotidase/2'',3''-cyclic phosphodiesterase and related esterases